MSLLLIILVQVISEVENYSNITANDKSTLEKQNNTTATNITIYGFWTGENDPVDNQPEWNTLTHVAFFSWSANSDGTLNTPSFDLPNYFSLIKLAHQNGAKVTICITCFDQDAIDNILANNKDDFANNILDVVQRYGADGVNLDLEVPREINSITKTPNSDLFANLMKTTYLKLKASNKNCHISFDAGWDMPSVWCNPNIKPYIDSIFLMCYDYPDWTRITGPNSPYNDSNRSDICKAISNTLNFYEPHQIILGVPFYGYDFTTTSDQPGSPIISKEYINMSTAMSDAQKYGRIWDSESNTPWCRYKSGATWHQVWYDDSESLKLKYNYMKAMNLGGIGFWNLQYVQGYPSAQQIFKN
jgi:spore germination protein YaaH